MHISKILSEKKSLISFEFFPPKTEEASKTLFQTIRELMPLEPAYVSVTYGAGGSTRKLTQDLVVRLRKETKLTIVSHLTCIGASRDEIGQILESYNECGIENIMALRGDPPAGQNAFVPPENGFHHASELVEFIKKNYPNMGIGVAGFPEGHSETPNRLLEMDYFKKKVDCGADYICTQMFFENRDFYDFQERCAVAGIHIPIIAGIMPITSLKNMKRMAELSLGSRFPGKLLKALYNAADENEAERIGIEWSTDQVNDLLKQKVKGIHFYTLNRSSATLKIYNKIDPSFLINTP